MVGIRFKTYRMLFELGEREAMIAGFRQVVGLQKTYSEKQADLWIVLSMVPGKRDGYYVDVGSGDGEFVSNTKLLDDLGWKGVCIDPFPTNMSSRTCQLFRQPVFSVSGKKVSFRAAGLLGGITESSGGVAGGSGLAVDASGKVLAIQHPPLVDFSTATLDEILEKAHAPRHIDLMSIDIEGAEYEALRGLSLDKYQVQAFVIEHNFEEPKRHLVRELLESKGYTLLRSWYRDDWYVLHDLPYRFKLVQEERHPR